LARFDLFRSATPPHEKIHSAVVNNLDNFNPWLGTPRTRLDKIFLLPIIPMLMQKNPLKKKLDCRKNGGGCVGKNYQTRFGDWIIFENCVL
jgi:hypothetical protein